MSNIFNNKRKFYQNWQIIFLQIIFGDIPEQEKYKIDQKLTKTDYWLMNLMILNYMEYLMDMVTYI